MYPKDDDIVNEHEIDEFDLDDDDRYDDDDGDDDVLDCPSCGQPVHDDTDKCPHCGDWIMPLAAESEKPVWLRLIAAIVIMALLFGVIRALTRWLF